MLQDNLRELERNLEVSITPSPSEQGVYVFELDDQVTVQFHDLEEGTYLFCRLCEAPSTNREDVFIKLSELNLLSEGSLGSVFGMTEDSKFLTLSRLIDYDVGYPQFYEIVEDFINLAKITLEEIR